MNNKVEISKITITIDGQEMHLSMDQVKELKKQLDEIFPAPAPFFWEYVPQRWNYRWDFTPYSVTATA